MGRITEKAESIDGVTHAYAYGYDVAGRLTDVVTDAVPTAHYNYDTNGNRTGGFNQVCSAIDNVSIDEQDRLSTLDCGPSAVSYTYTANGELLTKTDGDGTTTYTYDVLGNLKIVLLPNGDQIDYVIDGKNRRVGKKVNGTVAQGWLYDGQLRIIAELDGSNQVVSRFVYGNRRNVPEYMTKGGATCRILTDHLGSPRVVVNVADGGIAQRMDYDEFGNVIVDANLDFQPFGFAGGLYDGDTKVVRFGARDYDPETGRWTIKDPIRFRGGDTDLYAYGQGDPVNSADPSGLGPSSFLVVLAACTAVEGGRSINDLRDPVRLAETLYLLRDQLKRVNERLANSQCVADTADLLAARNRLIRAVGEVVQAQFTSGGGLGNDAGVEGLCTILGGLALLPIFP